MLPIYLDGILIAFWYVALATSSHLYSFVKIDTLRIWCLAQEHTLTRIYPIARCHIIQSPMHWQLISCVSHIFDMILTSNFSYIFRQVQWVLGHVQFYIMKELEICTFREAMTVTGLIQAGFLNYLVSGIWYVSNYMYLKIFYLLFILFTICSKEVNKLWMRGYSFFLKDSVVCFYLSWTNGGIPCLGAQRLLQG